MKKELEEKLVKDFPNLFAGVTKSPKEGLMCFGCECGDGWYELIRGVCEKIKDYKDVEFFQIKEKFGELRMYTGAVTDKVHDIIEEACEQSVTVCEACGKPGKIRGGGWVRTLCDECIKGTSYEKKGD